MDSPLVFPFDIFLEIARSSLIGWKLMLSIPQFARFTLTEEGLRYAEKNHSHTTPWGDHYLGNLLHHRTLPYIVGSYSQYAQNIYSLLSKWYQPTVEKNPLQLKNEHLFSPNGTQLWYYKGKMHRENDLPAMVRPKRKGWYKNDKLHRDNDQPALIIENEGKEWYMFGRLHRDDDLPAIVRLDGTKAWYTHGKLHRENGFAFIWPSGKGERWINGEIQN